MLSHYLNPLLAWKYQNAAVPQQEERRKVRKKKARKTRLGFIEPHGSINDSHRLKFRSKEMLLGSTQCSSPFSPFLSTLGAAVGSSAAVPRAPPAPLVTGHRLAKLLVTFSASGSFLIEAVSAERSERQSTGRNSHDYSRAFFFCWLQLGQQSMEQAPRTPLQAARRSPCSACSRGKQAIYI